MNKWYSKDIALLLVDSSISLPAGIGSFEKLRKALKEDIYFMVFKNSNKRKLQSLEYIPDKEGGDTSNFISNYNAEINNVEEQKIYFYQTLPNILLIELLKSKMINASMNNLIKEFEDIVSYESNLIRNGSFGKIFKFNGKFMLYYQKQTGICLYYSFY
jgi:hypothetical protein